MRVRLRPACLAAVAAGALLAAPGAASASSTPAMTAATATTPALAPAQSVLTATGVRPAALLPSASLVSLTVASRGIAARRPQSGRGEAQQLPAAGFDGMLVAAIGTGLTVAGWLLILAGGRRLRRRAGRRG